MATLIFSAIGTAIGGPLGGAIGALVGRQVDTAIFGSPSREGPRLKELSVTTSSYGSPIPRHFGRMRVAGSIVWATDLVEHKDRQGGGKGSPSVTTYNYSASFAVALSSRPLARIGRIWADGNLLRGAADDLKVGGKLRFYAGHGDQTPDPLLAAAEAGGRCPAYRGLAYAVFENLQLSDYGNRIPALTFEVFADDADISVADLVAGVVDNIDAQLPLSGIVGISNEGPLGDLLSQIDPVFPFDCDVAGDVLTLRPDGADAPLVLREAALATADDGFGAESGFARKRLPAANNPKEILRYYDVDREYQPGLQRASGRPQPGQPASIELPAALTASVARGLIDTAARRAGWARQTMSWRTAEIDPDVRPGSLVRIPGQPGVWRVNDWEWRANGVEFGLWRAPGSGGYAGSALATDSGRAAPPIDAPTGPTSLTAFELPWDGSGAGDLPAVFAAASSEASGWSGSALYLDQGDGQLQPLGNSTRVRCTTGHAATALEAGSPHLFDRTNAVTIALLGDDMVLTDATVRQLAMGANRALLGSELVQFTRATPLGDGQWRLEGLLRGRGGTESAIAGHAIGEPFVLLDRTPVALDGAAIGHNPAATILAIGLGDSDPAAAPIGCRGLTQRPLFPVHPRMDVDADGSLTLRWTRRSRGVWTWLDGVEAPLHEQAESYDVIVGSISAPLARWTTANAFLRIDSAQLAFLHAAAPGEAVIVRQRGSYAVSEPLLLTTLP